MRRVLTTSQRRTRFSRPFFCEHCNENLSKTQYLRHKRLYFDEVSGTWSNRLATASYAMPDPFSSPNSSEDEIMTEEQTQGKAFY